MLIVNSYILALFVIIVLLYIMLCYISSNQIKNIFNNQTQHKF